jgi:hypothetical protein
MKRITLTGSVILGLGLALVPLTASAGSITNSDAVMLNPQPLPPGPAPEKVSFLTHGEAVMLNPQPLPPKIFKKKHFGEKR